MSVQANLVQTIKKICETNIRLSFPWEPKVDLEELVAMSYAPGNYHQWSLTEYP